MRARSSRSSASSLRGEVGACVVRDILELQSGRATIFTFLRQNHGMRHPAAPADPLVATKRTLRLLFKATHGCIYQRIWLLRCGLLLRRARVEHRKTS